VHSDGSKIEGKIGVSAMTKMSIKCKSGMTFIADHISKKGVAPFPVPVAAGTSTVSSNSGGGTIIERSCNPPSSLNPFSKFL
jgi:hypothetical protein